MLLNPLIQRYKKLLFLITLLVSFIGIYALLLGIFTPYYLQQKLPTVIHERSTLSLHIDEIRINPFSLSVEINHVNLQDKNKQSLAAFERLYINFQLSSLFRQLWYFDALILESPSVHYQIYNDFSNNIEQLNSLISKDKASLNDSTIENHELDSVPGNTIPELLVKTLRIDNLAIQFTDDAKKPSFNTHIGPLNIALDNFTTQKDLNSSYSLKATSASGIIGSSFEWQGFIGFLPFRSEGQFVIKEINLPKAYRYIKDELPTLLTAGMLNLNAHYRIDFSQEKMLFNVDNANFSFLDVTLQRKDQDLAAIKLGELMLKNVNYSSKLHQLSLDQLALNRSNVSIAIDKQGELNLSEFFTQKASESANNDQDKDNLIKDSSGQGTQLKLAIDKITFNDNNLYFIDNSTTKVTELEVSHINMNIASFNLQPNSRFPIDFSAIFEKNGTVKAVGEFSIQPLSSRFDILAKNLPVLSIEQYIQQFIISEIVSGDVNLAMKLDYQQQSNQTKTANNDSDKVIISGNITLNNWRTKLANEDKDYARIEQISLDGINYSQPQNTLDIEKMTVDNLWLNARRNDEGIINIANLHRPQKNTRARDKVKSEQVESEQVESEQGEHDLISVNLKHFQMNSADILYTDYAVTPRYKMQISPLDIVIKGLSTKVNSRADIDVEAKLNRFAPLTLKGSVNLLSDTLYTNFNLRLNDIQMSDMTPYSGTFIGREIDQGKLNLDINYVIEEEQLRAENTVFIDQLELGNNVKSEQATSLPIGLAVSLLKDSNQEIHIDMPISGNLNDPKFSYGQLVWQTFGNLIVKAVSSPFSLLASLVDSDEDLGAITFSAGSAKVEEIMVKRLELLSQALNKRPELQLSITGCYHPEDIRVIKNILLQQRINPENIVITESDYLLLLEAEYVKNTGSSYIYDLKADITEPNSITIKKIQLHTELIAKFKVSENKLVSLAQQRSRNIQQLLITKYQLATNRLVIGKVIALKDDQALSCALAPQG